MSKDARFLFMRAQHVIHIWSTMSITQKMLFVFSISYLLSKQNDYANADLYC